MVMDSELIKLKTIMTRQGWDYEATARKLGVGTRTLWRWINEKRSPGKMGLNAIRRFNEENEC
jgi:transcriptional regulator with XRE-family HTH domain